MIKDSRFYTPLEKGCRKVLFYLQGFIIYFANNKRFRKKLYKLLGNIPANEEVYVINRVNYYNKMSESSLEEQAIPIGQFKYPFTNKQKYATYFFDLYKHVKYYNPQLRFSYKFGDITEEPSSPAIVKSRPITQRSSNAVIMKLNQVRHFVFVKDPKRFSEKKNLLVSRNIVRQTHRIKFLEMYYGHPLCNVGQINKDVTKGHEEWVKKRMSINEQLDYKFICCIEGNDVATNLKWVMSSNSLAVMPAPRFESWFMEGTLIPNYHYVEIKPDYSDLIERTDYYINHPDEAEAILEHAHEYTQQFHNAKTEKLISLLVLKKYFQKTDQL